MSVARYIGLCCTCCLSFLDLRVLDVTSVFWTRGFWHDVMSGFVHIKTSQTEFSYKYICEGNLALQSVIVSP